LSTDELPAELAAMEEFLTAGVVTSVLSTLKSGKEAATYLCHAGGEFAAHRLIVAKVYHDRNRRNFKNDGIYNDGRVILASGQVKRAIGARTEFGLQVDMAMWVDREFDALSDLHYAGADVPEPCACTSGALLMEYIGDESGAAPQLQAAKLSREDAEIAADRLLRNIEIMLDNHRVHGDLSPFNVLYWKGRPVIIDLPQSVDPRQNRNARSLLLRDIENLAKYFRRQGVEIDAEREVANLWRRYTLGELG
jgi:RIO kinase 1